MTIYRDGHLWYGCVPLIGDTKMTEEKPTYIGTDWGDDQTEELISLDPPATTPPPKSRASKAIAAILTRYAAGEIGQQQAISEIELAVTLSRMLTPP